MLDYSFLDFSEFLENIIREQMIEDDAHMLLFLEQYKYFSREQLVSFLQKVNPDTLCDVIYSIDRDPKYREIELKYNVLISHDEGNSIVIAYDYSKSVSKDAIELEYLLNALNLVFVGVTPLNYYELAGQEPPALQAISVLKRVLIEAIDKEATDIHFEVRHYSDRTDYPILFRINGKIEPCELFCLNASLNKSIIGSLIEKKTSANALDLLDSSGVVASSSDVLGDNVELRISANKVKDGYHYVIRIQKKSTINFTINELGFHSEVIEAMQHVIKKRSGITLITGAIRTGKNTTAFAMANEMCKEPIKIVSYESPIEVLMPFAQVDYQEDSKILLNAIRLAKKQDVNIAFINEIPTKEVAFAVQDLVNSSIHVITTMHMDRIWHLPYKLKAYYGDDYKDIISQINIVFNQKMFGKCCKSCRDTILVDSLDNKYVKKFLSKNNITCIHRNHGCAKCNFTGIEPGSNQPYAEFIVFSDELVSRLLRCNSPAEMEMLLREEVKNSSLEKYMLLGVQDGELGTDALESIV